MKMALFSETNGFSVQVNFFPPQIVAGPLSLVAETPMIFRCSAAAELKLLVQSR